MSRKIPYVTKEKAEQIAKKYPTPFYLYDETGIRKRARLVNKAFAWNKGFKEYFAVKATPNPYILQILKEEGCGTDCSSLTELQMKSFLIMSDFRQKRNRRGEGYGWFVAELETPETKWGYDFIGSRYSEKPEESWKAIGDRMRECFPDARETDIQKMLCIRYPDGKAIL